ncbi:phosphoribosyltransferase [Sediminispirochaeta smaragdinae]|uniref:Phosphoribosyltransferase n=1 Tax=Sediminispirochaeta smaragdinae (strain DSM 11293 / JCM 15392 / SEBR 4228) TaxID=573413 RepID=E1RCD0_SEDSS|nr:phosphoribosyltransferase [Sediminispirochaeta smaragdinae]ADK80010.1 phosphoribosyltransferase [Sediminispirochaeta smaragdinae DSM 11293]
MAAAEKYYLTYNTIHKAVKHIASQIMESGFDPDIIVAIGTGGFIPARMLRTFIDRPILTVGLSYYDEFNKPKEFPRKIQWIDEVESKLKGKKVLLVDEVDDTRVTLEYCLKELLQQKPSEMAVAVLHNKQKKKIGTIPQAVKRYYCGKTLDDVWICYPWDAEDIDEQEHLAAAAVGR